MASHAFPPRHTQQWRDKIKVGVLLNKLADHVCGKGELSRTQVMAAQILLRKVLPDLSSTELAGQDGAPLQVNIVRFADLSDEEKPPER